MSKIYTHMPILREGFEVSMELLSERWADKNHGQTRQRLAQRGGLSPSEAVAVMECRPWRPMEDKPAMEVLRDAQRAFDYKMSAPKYLVVGHGESDTPVMFYARDRADVKRALLMCIYGEPHQQDGEECVEGMMATFDDPDTWVGAYPRMEVRFEIGGVEVTQLFVHDLPKGD